MILIHKNSGGVLHTHSFYSAHILANETRCHALLLIYRKLQQFHTNRSYCQLPLLKQQPAGHGLRAVVFDTPPSACQVKARWVYECVHLPPGEGRHTQLPPQKKSHRALLSNRDVDLDAELFKQPTFALCPASLATCGRCSRVSESSSIQKLQGNPSAYNWDEVRVH